MNNIEKYQFPNCCSTNIEEKEYEDFSQYLKGLDTTGFLPFFKSYHTNEPGNPMKQIINDKMPDISKTMISDTLNESEKLMIENHFQINIFDCKNDNFEADIDYGIQEFQKKFYMKYVTQKEPKESSDKSKGQTLKISVKMHNNTHIYLTRNEMDEQLGKFKKLFYSYNRLRHVLMPSVSKLFFRIFNFEHYLIIQSSLLEDLVVIETHKSFDLKWKRTLREQLKIFTCENNKYKYTKLRDIDLKKHTLDYFSHDCLVQITKATELCQVEIEDLIRIQVQIHYEFFEFLLKTEQISPGDKWDDDED